MAAKTNASVIILASGNGSNARAIATNSDLASRIAAVVSDRKNSRVLDWATKAGYVSTHVSLDGCRRDRADQILLDTIRPFEPTLIVLAGFMRILGSRFVDEYEGRIVNIHPSLLPEHPGLNAIERSWNAGDRRIGITVHLVDHGVDTGPTLAKASLPRERFADLSAAVEGIHELEHSLYPAVIAEMLSRVSSGHVGSDSFSLPSSTLRAVLPPHAQLDMPKEAPE
ncbi:MAG: phosphoribosylglycinamide formyltransferase [Spirochaetales bacterium]